MSDWTGKTLSLFILSSANNNLGHFTFFKNAYCEFVWVLLLPAFLTRGTWLFVSETPRFPYCCYLASSFLIEKSTFVICFASLLLAPLIDSASEWEKKMCYWVKKGDLIWCLLFTSECDVAMMIFFLSFFITAHTMLLSFAAIDYFSFYKHEPYTVSQCRYI